MIRQKRKPDSIKVNFVQSVPGKRKSVKIKPVSYPFNALNSSPSVPSNSTSSSVAVESDPSFEDAYLPSELLDNFDQGKPGTHRVRKEKAAEAWAEIRSKIVPAMMSTLGFPNQGVCIFCKSTSIAVWCPDCGSNAYLCKECAKNLHEEINIFHSPMLWKVLY